MSSIVRRLMRQTAGSTGPHEAHPPEGIRQLNDSVWEFCCPTRPDVDIIFFHGLQIGDFEDAFWKTWLDKNGEVVWPKEWLSKKLPNARILSISYNSSATRAEGQLDTYNLGENLVSDIILDSTVDIGHERPVFLVGHSLGGIVIKQFILSAVKQLNLKEGGNQQKYTGKIRTFLECFKGVFYYATPHAGSEVADSTLTEFAGMLDTSPILGLLKTLNTKRQRINEMFRRQEKILHSSSSAVAEGRVTTYKWFNGKFVVGEYSARQYVDDFYTYSGADHFEVCKARTENDPTVIGRLTDFITRAAPKVTYNPGTQSELDIR